MHLTELDKAKVTQALATEVEVKIFERIDSTNRYAKEKAPNLNKPLIVLAQEQTKGYGKRDRFFDSPKDTGIYLTIALPLKTTSTNLGLLTLATSLVVCQTIEKLLTVKPQIKWVNDLIYQDKKLGGILTEAFFDLDTAETKQVIVGIGLNYLTDLTCFSPDLKAQVSTLKDIVLTKKITKSQFVNELLKQFFQMLATYQTGAFLEEYRQRSNLLNQEVTLHHGKHLTTGVVLDFTQEGYLKLTDGRIFPSAEVIKVQKK